MWTGLTIDPIEIAKQAVEFMNAYWPIIVLAIGPFLAIKILKEVKGVFN
ncbi:hypothetical protein [Brevibacillus formosus]